MSSSLLQQNNVEHHQNKINELKIYAIIVVFYFVILSVALMHQKTNNQINKEPILTPNKKKKLLLIGIVGNKKVGKDTFVDYLIENTSTDDMFQKQSLAKPIKDILEIMFGFSHEQLYDQDYKEKIDERWGETPRKCMQNLGDLLEEDFPKRFPYIMKKTGGERIVITILKRFLMSKMSMYKKHQIISDVRRLDEAKAIKDLGGILIKIERPGYSNLTDSKTHISESEISKIQPDFLIENNGTIPELYTKAEELMNKILDEKKDVILLNNSKKNKNDLPD